MHKTNDSILTNHARNCQEKPQKNLNLWEKQIKSLNNTDFNLLLSLFYFVFKYEYAFPSYKTFAKYAGVSERTARRFMKKNSLGFLSKKRRGFSTSLLFSVDTLFLSNLSSMGIRNDRISELCMLRHNTKPIDSIRIDEILDLGLSNPQSFNKFSNNAISYGYKIMRGMYRQYGLIYSIAGEKVFYNVGGMLWYLATKYHNERDIPFIFT